MEKIEIYSSKRKAFWLLIGSSLFVAIGVYMIIHADKESLSGISSPLLTKIIGVLSVLFFGLGVYLSIRQLIGNRLMLIIDKYGVNVNPKRSLTECIEWKNIDSFSELKLQNQKFVIINVNNAAYWIEKEENKIRKKLMKFNLNNYQSPFNLSANTLQINHAELMKILNENLRKSKNNV